jgi:2-amino-4-hydroxy-6-hydroxymethyldihydropteridine diphosphokinase
MPRQVYLGLGSNLGDRAGYLRRARENLAPEVNLLRASSVYETPPWGYTDQPAFLNQVVEVQTDLEPEALLVKLKGIESELGRVKNFRYGPRCIDLDILFYENRVYQSERLTIPHPSLAERAFVLVPINELAPNFVHPLLHKAISELLAALGGHEISLYQGETP